MDAVVYTNEAVPITVKLPLMVPPASGRYAGAYEAVSAYDADPCKLPKNDAVTVVTFKLLDQLASPLAVCDTNTLLIP